MTKKRGMALFLVLMLAMQCSSYALDAPTKEETVYVNLGYDGSLEGIYVVNAFRVQGGELLVDYGDYSRIKNLTNDSEAAIKGKQITWQVPKDCSMFYYQGEMKTGRLPWEFHIDYRLDGKKVEGGVLAGRSGHVELAIEARADDRAESYFKENYIAQLSLTLDGKKCSNILSNDAIFANVGSNKQLTFMILPGESKRLYVSFDAVDFEMDGLTIALVKLSDSLSSNIEGLKVDMSAIASSVSDLVSGTGALKNGAESLSSGVSLLNNGAQNIANVLPEFSRESGNLAIGAQSLEDGMQALAEGSSDVRSGLIELDARSADVASGISSLEAGLKTMTDNEAKIQSGLRALEQEEDSVNRLTAGALELKTGYKQLETGLSQMAGSAGDIRDGLEALEEESTDMAELISGAQSVYGGVQATHQGLEAIVAAMETTYGADDPYVAQLKALSASMGPLETGAQGVYLGTRRAQSGINTLYGAALKFGQAAGQLSEAAQSAYAAIQTLNAGFDSLYQGLGKAAEIYDVARTFGRTALSLVQGAKKIENGAGTLRTGFSSYAEGVGLLAGKYITFDNAVDEAKDGSSQLKEGTFAIRAASESLSSVFGEFSGSVQLLDSSTLQLLGGADTLSMGTESAGTIYTSYGKDIASLIAVGEGVSPVSFAAPGIVTPSRVQFVIKTPDIVKEDEKKADVAEESKGVMQEIIDLFPGGGYSVIGVLALLTGALFVHYLRKSRHRRKETKKRATNADKSPGHGEKQGSSAIDQKEEHKDETHQ